MKIQILRAISILTALMVGFWLPLRMLGYEISESITLCCDLLVSLASVINVYLFFKDPTVSSRHSPRKISTWLNLNLVLDLICVIPWAALDKIWVGHESNMLLFLNLLTARHIWRIRAFLDYFNTIKPVYFRLIPIIFIMPLLVHLIACGWIAMGSGTAGPNPDHLTEYVKAIYWSFTTLTTVGYGDITAKTIDQMLLTCCVELVGVGVFGFILSNVASLLSRMDAAREHHMDSVEHVETFMQSHNIPESTRNKVRTYFQYLWKRHKGYQDRTLLESLPVKMQAELYFLINAPVISKVALFKKAHPDLIRSLTSQLEPKIYVPGEKIFEYGEPGDSMYFLHNGEIQIVAQDQTLIATLHEGHFFGEMALMTEGKRNATAIAVTFCDVYYLSREAFNRVLKKHPEFKEHVEHVARERLNKTA